MFTDGISIPAAALAGCAKGAIGGAITYALIGDSGWSQDTSVAGDARDYLNERMGGSY